MSDTLHQNGSNWSQPSGLLSSLASKWGLPLQKTTGSMIFSMRWKRKATPQGRLYYRLAASAHPISDSDYSFVEKGWTTPSSRDWKDTPGMAQQSVNKDGSIRNRLDMLPRQAASTINPPAWMRCPDCDEWWCTIHKKHVHECQCLPVEHWKTSPYSAGTGQSTLPVPKGGGLLNVELTRWLMGYPPEWDCAEEGHPEQNC